MNPVLSSVETVSSLSGTIAPISGSGFPLAELPEVIGPCKVRGTLTGSCRDIVFDSRQVRPGMIFAALPGEHADGADYIDDALKLGAVLILGENLKRWRRKVPAIEVPDARVAMARIASAVHGHPSRRLTTVGVTGTNGKTSVTCLVRDILRGAGHRPGLIGTVGYEYGARSIPAARTTPESADLHRLLSKMEQAGCGHAVMEVSSHALSGKRVHDVDFDVAVFTNLSQDHLDFHRSMDAYFEAKARLFTDRYGGGPKMHRVINVDDAWGRKLALRAGSAGKLITYGTFPEARVRAESVEVDAQGIRFRLISPWGEAAIQLPLLGRFNVSNALAAIAVAGVLEVPLEDIAASLARAENAPGRMESIANAHGILAFVDYAHTEDALAKALDTVRELTDGRVICVFGCGGDRDRLKRPLMGRACSKRADVTILTSDNPRSEDPEAIAQDIGRGCCADAEVELILNRRNAIREAVERARPGDVVLVAGKGHESTMQIGKKQFRFDDRDELRDALDALG